MAKPMGRNPDESDVFVFASGDGTYLVRPADFVAHEREVRFRSFTDHDVVVALRLGVDLRMSKKAGVPTEPKPRSLREEGGRWTLSLANLPAGVYEYDVWVKTGSEWVRAVGNSSPRIIVDP